MKKNLRYLFGTAVGALAALVFSSCAYDPYYSSASTSVGASYSSGGGGYGGSSTSLFVSTGDPRWGYDPYSHSYYDYSRRSYYDPYLYGYYPVGYRPPVVYGAPHPHGWHSGRGYCPPPSRYRDVRLSNYRDRESSYRDSGYGWARQVRRNPDSERRVEGMRIPENESNRRDDFGRSRTNLRVPDVSPSRGFERQNNASERSVREGRSDARQQEISRPPSSRNMQVTTGEREFRQQREKRTPQFEQNVRQRSPQIERRAEGQPRRKVENQRNNKRSEADEQTGRVRSFR